MNMWSTNQEDEVRQILKVGYITKKAVNVQKDVVVNEHQAGRVRKMRGHHKAVME